MGVPPTTMLFTAPYKGPTPNKIYRAQIITTGDLVSLLKKDKNLILVDTSGLKDTLPIGYSLPDAGSDGSVTDGLQADLDAWLMKKTGGKRDQPIVFLGAGMNDRSSTTRRCAPARWAGPPTGIAAASRPGWPTACRPPRPCRPRTSDPSTAPCSIGARATKVPVSSLSRKSRRA